MVEIMAGTRGIMHVFGGLSPGQFHYLMNTCQAVDLGRKPSLKMTERPINQNVRSHHRVIRNKGNFNLHSNPCKTSIKTPSAQNETQGQSSVTCRNAD